MKYPKVEYYCEETIYEFTIGRFDCRCWFDTNKTDLTSQHEVMVLAHEVFRDHDATDGHRVYAQELANCLKPHGLNALSVKISNQPAYMIYTTPFQEGESAHG